MLKEIISHTTFLLLPFMKLIKIIEGDHFPASNIYPLILSLPNFYSEINNYNDTTFDYEHVHNQIIRRLKTTGDYQ